MSIILEDKRNELINKQKKSRNYVPSNQYMGKNRYERRLKSRVSSSVKHFNRIDMNKLFKEDIIDVNIDVKGETNVYVSRVAFYGVLDEIHNYINGGQAFERKTILKSLTRAFNRGDIYMRCSCPDFHYRHAHHMTTSGFILGEKEDRPNRFDWTNKNKDMGPACKHLTLTLTDSSWLIKVASVIYNYVTYLEEKDKRLYQKIIYPAIYQKQYEDEVQLDITDIEGTDELETGADMLDTANITAKKRGQFQKDNEYRFKKELSDDGEQQSFNIDSIEDEE